MGSNPRKAHPDNRPGLLHGYDSGLPVTFIRREWQACLNFAVCVLVSVVALLTIHNLLIRAAFVVFLILVAGGGVLLVLAFRRNAQAGIPPTRWPMRPALRIAFVVYEVLILIGVVRYFAR